MATGFGSATEMLSALRAGRTSAEEWSASCLDRIANRDSLVHAWVNVDADKALKQARRVDSTDYSASLSGLPIGVKDVILTEAYPTCYNSPIYEDFHPCIDAACVKLLRAAGATILGKTETVEFAAARRVAPTRNPLDLARTPGGSSSGSAAAVADGHVPVALGTQTGGSLIRPASYCGIFAFKPTWSRISRDGIRMYAASLDTLGWFARTAADLALVYEALTPDVLVAPQSSELKDTRIAICQTPFPDRAADYTREGLADATRRLTELGVAVETLTLPAEFEGIDRSHHVVMRAEGRSAFLPEYRADLALLNDHLRDLVENVDDYSEAELVAAYDHAAQCRKLFDRLAAPYDAVLTYSVAGIAPCGINNNGSADFNSLWTLLHVPCANIPSFAGPNGMPVGLTLTGPRMSDRRVLAVAETLASVLCAETIFQPA